MTVFAQVGRNPIQGGDRSVKNYGVTDIPAGTAVMWDLGASNLNGVLAPTTSQALLPTCGITIEKIPAGKTGRVAVAGTAVATANATLAAGAAVDIDVSAGNEGKVTTHGSATKSLGSVCAAAVAGDAVEVQINVCPNA